MATAWAISFKALLESSEKIIDSNSSKNFEYFRVKLMLRGMALECHMKTLVISKGIKMLDDDGKLNNLKIQSHDLIALSKYLNIRISEEETSMLKILSVAIELGRYPVTSKDKQIGKFWISPTFEDLFYSFIKKVDILIDTETTNLNWC